MNKLRVTRVLESSYPSIGINQVLKFGTNVDMAEMSPNHLADCDIVLGLVTKQ